MKNNIMQSLNNVNSCKIQNLIPKIRIITTIITVYISDVNFLCNNNSNTNTNVTCKENS